MMALGRCGWKLLLNQGIKNYATAPHCMFNVTAGFPEHWAVSVFFNKEQLVSRVFFYFKLFPICGYIFLYTSRPPHSFYHSVSLFHITTEKYWLDQGRSCCLWLDLKAKTLVSHPSCIKKFSLKLCLDYYYLYV